ncbi:hypothetical protein D3C79_934490 [compost metagenome]
MSASIGRPRSKHERKAMLAPSAVSLTCQEPEKWSMSPAVWRKWICRLSGSKTSRSCHLRMPLWKFTSQLLSTSCSWIDSISMLRTDSHSWG